MTDLSKPKKNGRAESKDVTWPLGQKEPLDAPTHNWSRELNQAPDNPGVSNPIHGRKRRDAYAGWSH